MPASPPVPGDESARLAELHATGILDTLPEPLYDDIAALASRLCDTPIAMVNFVDHDRQWGKALVGLEDSEEPREASFCSRTIARGDRRLVVEDTLRDPAFAANPQVMRPPGLRFYAGAAIVTPRGHALGSVCVADRRPRTVTAEQLADLERLATHVAALLESRLVAHQLAAANETLLRLASHDELTKLPNRRLVRELVEHQLAVAERHGTRVGVVFADVNDLKVVNDAGGHAAGDTLLRDVAAELRGIARAADTVGRIAGDEVVVVCGDVERGEDLERVAQRVRSGVTHRVAVGIALSQRGDDVDGLLARADAAMYDDKPPPP